MGALFRPQEVQGRQKDKTLEKGIQNLENIN